MLHIWYLNVWKTNNGGNLSPYCDVSGHFYHPHPINVGTYRIYLLPRKSFFIPHGGGLGKESVTTSHCIWRQTPVTQLLRTTLVNTQNIHNTHAHAHTHTDSGLRCSNLLKQKRLTLNSCCTYPLQAGIITLPGWDTAKKRTSWVKLLQVVYLLSLILPRSECVVLRAHLSVSLSAVWDLPKKSPRAETMWEARQARQHPGIMRTPSDGMKSSCKTAHAASAANTRRKSWTFSSQWLEVLEGGRETGWTDCHCTDVLLMCLLCKKIPQDKKEKHAKPLS